MGVRSHYGIPRRMVDLAHHKCYRVSSHARSLCTIGAVRDLDEHLEFHFPRCGLPAQLQLCLPSDRPNFDQPSRDNPACGDSTRNKVGMAGPQLRIECNSYIRASWEHLSQFRDLGAIIGSGLADGRDAWGRRAWNL